MPTADREGLGVDREALREEMARLGFAGWYGRDEYDEHPVQGMWERTADAQLAGPLLSAALAQADSAERMEAERDEAQARAEGDLAAGNEVLRAIGTFDRTMKVGKHQATNYVHLRATIAALDADGHHDAADTLIWQIWHRVNSVARAQEFARIDAQEREAAQADITRLSAEVEARDKALKQIAGMKEMGLVADERPDGTAAFEWGEKPTQAALLAASALTRTTDQPDPGAREGSV